jgi:hypothetical protein
VKYNFFVTYLNMSEENKQEEFKVPADPPKVCDPSKIVLNSLRLSNQTAPN